MAVSVAVRRAHVTEVICGRDGVHEVIFVAALKFLHADEMFRLLRSMCFSYFCAAGDEGESERRSAAATEPRKTAVHPNYTRVSIV